MAHAGAAAHGLHLVWDREAGRLQVEGVSPGQEGRPRWPSPPRKTAPRAFWSGTGVRGRGRRDPRRGVRVHGLRGQPREAGQLRGDLREVPREPRRVGLHRLGDRPALVHARGREALAVDDQARLRATPCLAGNAVGVLHDVEAALYGSHARHEGRRDRPRRRPRLSHAGDQRGEEGRIDPRARRVGADHRRDHARAHRVETSPTSSRARSATTGRSPRRSCDTLEAQAAMREQTTKATMVVMVASALHSIAAGTCSRRSAWRSRSGEMREITTICVDQTEFLVSKLKDRGTHQAFGVVTNARDFMRVLRRRAGSRVWGHSLFHPKPQSRSRGHFSFSCKLSDTALRKRENVPYQLEEPEWN